MELDEEAMWSELGEMPRPEFTWTPPSAQEVVETWEPADDVEMIHKTDQYGLQYLKYKKDDVYVLLRMDGKTGRYRVSTAISLHLGLLYACDEVPTDEVNLIRLAIEEQIEAACNMAPN